MALDWHSVDRYTDNIGYLQEKMPRNDRFHIELEPRLDKSKKTFYVAKLKCEGLTLDFTNGITFLVFTAESGNEELHITGYDKKNDEDDR